MPAIQTGFEMTLTDRPLLSVIVPVFNEERTIGELLRRLMGVLECRKEVIIVDDGSRDATPKILAGWSENPCVTILRHGTNQGKGAAVRTALAIATGEYAIIQDADLEYDPADLPRLLAVLCQNKGAIVYGSRYLSRTCALKWGRSRLAACLLGCLVHVLYGRLLTDEATCYKAARTDMLRAMGLQSKRFELCAEITAKACRAGIPIIEIPISYVPRSVPEGKKLGWRDAWPTVWALLKWRFARHPRARKDGMAIGY